MHLRAIKYFITRLPALALLLCLGACSKKEDGADISFYYWRTHWHLSDEEKNSLQTNQVKEVYVRLFDIDIRNTDFGPMPLAEITGIDTSNFQQKIIPVVFITNRTFKLLSDSLTKELARKTFLKIKSLCPHFRELQIDCDWTEKTAQTYFLFLKEVKKLMNENEILSATIRLHQVKYREITGVPPVDGGMLMFYNMGDVGNVKEKNSIFNLNKAEWYASFLKTYPLPLDVALPIFSWQVQFRDGKILNLFAKQNLLEMEESDFRNSELNTFVALKDQIHKGKFVREGDVIRTEQVSEKDLLEACDILKQNLKKEKRRIVFYDLDKYNLKHYENSLFKKISDLMH